MDKRRNILVLMTDQQRFDSLRCYGNQHALTPNLDRMAAQGALFTACYVQNPICSPSRATYATGLYPRNHGLWANGVTLPTGLPLLSKALADAGYACGMAGKQHLAPMAGNDEEPRLDDGYRRYRWSHGPNHPSKVNTFHAWLRKRHPDIHKAAILDQPRKTTEGNNSSKSSVPLDSVPVEAHYSHWIAQEAIDFIVDDSRPAHTPFYFMGNFFDPHHPFGAPEAYRSRFDASKLPFPSGSVSELDSKPPVLRDYSKRSYGGSAPGFTDYTQDELREIVASYYAMVALIDAEVGRIMDVLEKRGELDNTLVTFTTDHGDCLNDHGHSQKWSMFEQSVHVPGIVWAPGLGVKPAASDALASLMDVGPTILEFAGLKVPEWMQAQSLMPVVRGTGNTPRPYVVAEHFRDMILRSTERMTMIRNLQRKLVEFQDSSEGQLYDLEQDPKEIRNLWSDPAAGRKRQELLEELERWRSANARNGEQWLAATS